MGTAEMQGRLWGAKARDWAELAEGASRPLYDAVLDATGVGAGTRYLDVGCGTGLAAQMAAGRGAQAAGLDAAEPSLAIARERVPAGDFRVGDMEELPWPGGAFDVVTGFNAFQFAADPVGALREARRVARPGGRVAMAVWGRAEQCGMAAVAAAVLRFLPPPPPGADGPFALAMPGRLEGLLERADLLPLFGADVGCPFVFSDLETAQRALMSSGTFVAAAERVGPEPVREAIAASLEPFRTAGGYFMPNVFRYAVAGV